MGSGEMLHPLTDSPNGHNSQRWAKQCLEPGIPSQSHKSTSTITGFPDTFVENITGNGTSRSPTLGCKYCRRWVNLLS